jgi:hypothetical protein
LGNFVVIFTNFVPFFTVANPSGSLHQVMVILPCTVFIVQEAILLGLHCADVTA